jgi:ribosome-associated protein
MPTPNDQSTKEGTELKQDTTTNQNLFDGVEENVDQKHKEDPELEEFVQSVVSCMLDKKALALRVIALEGIVDYCDRLVICSAGASRQVAAIADHIHGVVKKELGRLPSGVEGRSNEQWVVMDYGDVMVHVFSHDARAYYAFDDLWLEAKVISLEKYGVEDEGALSNPDMARYL